MVLPPLVVGTGEVRYGARFDLIGVSGFVVAAGQETLCCGLFWFRRLGVVGVRPGILLGWFWLLGQVMIGAAGRWGRC